MKPVPGDNEIFYRTKAEEFEISFFRRTPGEKQTIKNSGRPAVFLIIKGTAEIKWSSGNKILIDKYEKGASFLIPACLSEFEITFPVNTEFFVAGVP